MSATEKYELGDAAKNPYAKDTDAFNRGMQLFKEGTPLCHTLPCFGFLRVLTPYGGGGGWVPGKLHQAVQAFEAVVHQQSDHSDAWRMLGVCHAENDEDTKAILCLGKRRWCLLLPLDRLLADSCKAPLCACFQNEPWRRIRTTLMPCWL